MNEAEDEEFTRDLWAAVQEAERHKYSPNYFKGMLNADGGYETVKRIVASSKPSEGFAKLVLMRKPELTCEAIIVETKWRRYFDEDLLALAEKRLRDIKYPFKRFAAPEPSTPDQEQPGTDGDDFVPPDSDDRDFAARAAALRPWQGKFRDALFERYGARCCVSQCAVQEALEAAHITPYLGEKSNDPRNGLVLRSDLHTLFDRYLLGIDPATLWVTLSKVLTADPSYRDFDGKELAMGTQYMPSRMALNVHWRKFNELQARE